MTGGEGEIVSRGDGSINASLNFQEIKKLNIEFK